MMYGYICNFVVLYVLPHGMIINIYCSKKHLKTHLVQCFPFVTAILGLA